MLDGCPQTGWMVLQDSTGTLPLVASVPPQATPTTTPPPDTHVGCSDRPEAVLADYGERIVVSDYWVVVERTTFQGSSSPPDPDLHMYVHPVTCAVVPPTDTPPNEGACPQSSSPSPSSPSSSSSSFLIGSGDGERDALFFRVICKNTVMVDPLRGLHFTCAATVHRTRPPVSCGGSVESHEGARDIEGFGDGGLESSGPLEVAILFRGAAFRWYSAVRNGCTYLLTLHSCASDMTLPPWEVLRANRSLTVTDDMVVRWVGDGRGSGGRGQDVLELVKQLLLPPLKTVRPHPELPSNPRWVWSEASLMTSLLNLLYRGVFTVLVLFVIVGVIKLLFVLQ